MCQLDSDNYGSLLKKGCSDIWKTSTTKLGTWHYVLVAVESFICNCVVNLYKDIYILYINMHGIYRSAIGISCE